MYSDLRINITHNCIFILSLNTLFGQVVLIEKRDFQKFGAGPQIYMSAEVKINCLNKSMFHAFSVV